MGTIAGLWRFPVKSMLGEQLDAVDVTEGGMLGDRAFGLSTGRRERSRARSTRSCGPTCSDAGRSSSSRRARRRAAAGADRPAGRHLRTSDAPDVDAVLSRFFGRDVELARAAPEDFTIDQYHPDQEDLDPEGHRDEVAETHLGSAFFNERGLPSACPKARSSTCFRSAC